MELKLDEEKREKITDFQNHFGNIYCTSGVGVTDKWITNWGLVELAQERVPSVEDLSSVSLYL
jgi:hypothetical protein